MYLSKLLLNPNHSTIRHDIMDCYELHRTLMSAFPDLDGEKGEARKKIKLLFRIENEMVSNRVQILVQSALKPNWNKLERRYKQEKLNNQRPYEFYLADISQALKSLKNNSRVGFRLLANPT
ncbi:MAG: type I-E CRISPR-associated protein Cas6/Cse3/CasE, partial [Candidatus Helarchaeota archaeon]